MPEPAPVLSRSRLVQAALDLLPQAGLDGLSMRGLADRLRVKAASLYWHVRDRDELLELMAATLLEQVGAPRTDPGWRPTALGLCAALQDLLERQPEAARLILQIPGALERSQVHSQLASALTGAGLESADAFETAGMMLSWVLVRSVDRPDEPVADSNRTMQVAIDSGSRGVTLRAGADMASLIRAAHDPTASAPAAIRGDHLVVRRLRGGRQGELELNPRFGWRFKVQAPTWNTVLDLVGLDVQEISIDSGAARVECILPAPKGVVPIEISSGVLGVRIRRPPSVGVVAELSGGVVQPRLDRWSVPATASDARWESTDGAGLVDHYLLRVHSGAVRVTLEEDASISAAQPLPASPVVRAGVVAALSVVLDGVAARTARV